MRGSYIQKSNEGSCPATVGRNKKYQGRKTLGIIGMLPRRLKPSQR